MHDAEPGSLLLYEASQVSDCRLSMLTTQSVFQTMLMVLM
jgi:hypothetical protein